MAYLECDPGQCEFTCPEVLSLHVLTQPVFGPSYTHLRTPIKYVCVCVCKCNGIIMVRFIIIILIIILWIIILWLGPIIYFIIILWLWLGPIFYSMVRTCYLWVRPYYLFHYHGPIIYFIIYVLCVFICVGPLSMVGTYCLFHYLYIGPIILVTSLPKRILNIMFVCCSHCMSISPHQ